MKKCLHINAKTQEITEIEIGGLKDMQAAVGGYIERAGSIDGNDLYVDEEGRLKGITYGFAITNYKINNVQESHFVGNGLVCGLRNADIEDTTISIEELRKNIAWIVYTQV